MINWIIVGVYIVGSCITFVQAYRTWTTEYPEDSLTANNFVDWFGAIFWSFLASVVWFLIVPLYLIWSYAGKERR